MKPVCSVSSEILLAPGDIVCIWWNKEKRGKTFWVAVGPCPWGHDRDGTQTVDDDGIAHRKGYPVAENLGRGFLIGPMGEERARNMGKRIADIVREVVEDGTRTVQVASVDTGPGEGIPFYGETLTRIRASLETGEERGL